MMMDSWHGDNKKEPLMWWEKVLIHPVVEYGVMLPLGVVMTVWPIVSAVRWVIG